jgi:hypothetical protein
MSNCSTFKILIDRFAGQRLSVTVDCSWARSGPQTSSPQARDNRRKFRAAPRKWHAKFLMPPEVSQMLGVRRIGLPAEVTAENCYFSPAARPGARYRGPGRARVHRADSGRKTPTIPE